MTDNENLDEQEGKQLSGYEKQRQKYQGRIDELQAQLEQERAWRIADKVTYFKSNLASQWYKGDFDEFANKYADKLGLDEMVALYIWTNGAVPAAPAAQWEPQPEPQNVVWPQSVIWYNPIGGDQAKDFSQLSIDEMKARGRANPQIFQE